MRAASIPKATERELLQLLERRHAKTGNGGSGEFAFLTHVRNDGGFNASRTFDAVAVSLWPSRGYAIDVFEVKVSRSDWLRELKDPAKSEAAWAIGDRFWIVATAGIVDPAELPHGWGLVEAVGGKVTDDGITGRKLRNARAAQWHGKPVKESADLKISRGLLVAMLRRAGAVPDQETPSEKALSEAEQRGRDAMRAQMDAVLEQSREHGRDLVEAVRDFETASGVKVRPYSADGKTEVLEQARRIRDALADDKHADRVRVRLDRMREELLRTVEQISTVLAEGGADS